MLKQLLKKAAHRFPSALPVGAEEFKAFCKDITETYGYPDKPGYRQLIGSLIQHTKEDRVKIPKRWFANAIRKAQVNETAYWAIEEAKKEAELVAKEEKLKQEATQPETLSAPSPAIN